MKAWPCLTLLASLAACADPPESGPSTATPEPPGSEAAAGDSVWFHEITDETGLDFRHTAGASGDYLLPEIMGGGAALFDHDGDGDLDLYLVDSGHQPGEGLPNRMYRQEADGSFVDVSAASGLGDPAYGMGVALGDVDNDGDLDLLATNLGGDVLYENLGGGSYRALPPTGGLDDEVWSSSACFFDYDADGWLDLYIATYVVMDMLRPCSDRSGLRDYCGPDSFRGVRDRLLRNLGPGGGGPTRFADVSDEALPNRPANRGLGVVCADLDGDGWTDVYVTNDGERNQLWINRGDGVFAEKAVVLGAALNMFSKPEASMGVAAGDIDGDLDLDLYMTHLDRETDTLYLNLGEAGFADRTSAAGLGPAGLSRTGFGTALVDLDLDGDLDLAAMNGRVRRSPSPTAEQRAWAAAANASEWLAPYAEPNLLFLNEGGGRFRDASQLGGALTSAIEVSRGLVAGDLDGDGDLDLVSTTSGGRARVFRNEAPRGGRWLKLRAIDPELGRDALGASVTVQTDRGSLLRPLLSASGYLTAVEPELHFGLGPAERVERVSVIWPGGDRESFPGDGPDRLLVVRKGEGDPE